MVITYNSSVNGQKITAALYNVIGQQLIKQEQICQAGNNTITFSNCNFSRGVYLVRLDNTEQAITQKILIP